MSAALTYADHDQPLTLWQISAQMQRIAFRLFDAQDWWRAFRVYNRVERLIAMLPKHQRPVIKADDPFPTALDSFEPPPPPTNQPLPSAEVIHRDITAAVPKINARLRQMGHPPTATFRSTLAAHAAELGPVVLARVQAIEDRLRRAPPSG